MGGADRRRSPRVLLQIPLVVKAEVPGGLSEQAQALSLVVNAHGGLLETSLKMHPGQKVVLLNPQSGRAVACKVLRVEEAYESNCTVAFEFDQWNSHFWPVPFPATEEQLSE